MKIESNHKAYDQLTECAREASEQNQHEIVEMVDEARAQLRRTWSLLVELEQGSAPAGELTPGLLFLLSLPGGPKIFLEK